MSEVLYRQRECYWRQISEWMSGGLNPIDTGGLWLREQCSPAIMSGTEANSLEWEAQYGAHADD